MNDLQFGENENISLLLEKWQCRYAKKKNPEHFFEFLNCAADYLRISDNAKSSIDLLSHEATIGVERYLTHRLAHARLRVLGFFSLDRADEAQEIITYFASRPYLFNDMSKLAFFLFFQGCHAAETRNYHVLARAVMLMAKTRAGLQDGALARLYHLIGSKSERKKIFKYLSFFDRVSIGFFLTTRYLAGKGVIAGLIGRALHSGFTLLRTVLQLFWKNASWMLVQRAEGILPTPGRQDLRPIVVARAMGGIGDLLMMTPGLKALHLKYPGRKIYFAIPKSFHSLFFNNPYFLLKDVNDDPVFREECSIFFNLTECPAAKIESATFPKVKKNRIDIFGSAMSVSAKNLNNSSRIPVYKVLDEEVSWVNSFLEERSIKSGQFIAIQPYAADSYKNYPHMEKVAVQLAASLPVLVFHGSPVEGFEHKNIFKVVDCSLRESIALLSQCKFLVAVDSSFVHAAAALEKQTIALFGPTDGGLFAKYYPHCRVIQASHAVGCSPCWRNQGLVCGRSKTVDSFCLGALKEEVILKNIWGGSSYG